jgi:hypothetical protein
MRQAEEQMGLEGVEWSSWPAASTALRGEYLRQVARMLLLVLVAVLLIVVLATALPAQ